MPTGWAAGTPPQRPLGRVVPARGGWGGGRGAGRLSLSGRAGVARLPPLPWAISKPPALAPALAPAQGHGASPGPASPPSPEAVTARICRGALTVTAHRPPAASPTWPSSSSPSHPRAPHGPADSSAEPPYELPPPRATPNRRRSRWAGAGPAPRSRRGVVTGAGRAAAVTWRLRARRSPREPRRWPPLSTRSGRDVR